MHAAITYHTLHTRHGRKLWVPLTLALWLARLTREAREARAAQRTRALYPSDTLAPREGSHAPDTAPHATALDTRAPLAPTRAHSYPAGLTRDTRGLIRLMRDTLARERTAGIVALADARPNRHAAAHAALIPAWRGLTPALDTRHSERGASGMSGVTGAASRVSQRDAHAPTALLRPMPARIVVGHATHPALTREQRAWLMDTVRHTPTLATVRVTHAGPHGRMMNEWRDGRIMDTVRPVSDYTAVRAQRHAARRATVQAQRADERRVALLASVAVYGEADTL